MAKVYAISTSGFHKRYTVVEDELCPITPAKTTGYLCCREEGLIIGFLHTQLYPATATLQCQTDTVKRTVSRGTIRDKLYVHFYLFSEICLERRHEWTVTG
jgi:hypothetical protein